MLTSLVSIGYGNFVSFAKVVAISSYFSRRIKDLVAELRARDEVIDLTAHHKTKSVLFLASGGVILCAFSPETLLGRLEDWEGDWK